MKKINKKVAIGISATAILIIVIMSVVVIFAAGVNFTVPYTFSSGTTISSSQMNANFQAIGQALPASKTISFGATAITTSNQNVSGLLTVTPPANGYIIVFGNTTLASLAADENVQSYICATDSSGNIIDRGIASTVARNVVYTQGYVTANTPLYFYLQANDIGGTGGGSIQGSLSALFIPTPNQLP